MSRHELFVLTWKKNMKKAFLVVRQNLILILRAALCYFPF